MVDFPKFGHTYIYDRKNVLLHLLRVEWEIERDEKLKKQAGVS